MPWTLFTQITNLFNKQFLFVSFLPTLLFLAGVLTTFASVLGLGTSFTWFGSLDASQQAVATVVASVTAVVMAYVAAGLRPVMISFWSGTLEYTWCRPFYGLGVAVQRRRYDRIRRRARRSRVWEPVLRTLRDEARKNMEQANIATPDQQKLVDDATKQAKALTPTTPLAEFTKLVDKVSALQALYTPETLLQLITDLRTAINERDAEHQRAAGVLAGSPWPPLLTKLANAPAVGSPDQRLSIRPRDDRALATTRQAVMHLASNAPLPAVTVLVDRVVALYATYDVETLTTVYAPLIALLNERVVREQQAERDATVDLDREYGPATNIRATRLGNLIESYLSYPFVRYRMESQVLWAALRSVVTSTYLQVLDESRVYVDFGVTMATYAAIYAALALWVGPWLVWNPWVWGPLTAVGIVTAYGFYWMAVMSVSQYGDVHRACIDLHRLSLMKALHREMPKSLAVERAQWSELSQLAAYGDSDALDFPLSPEFPQSPLSLPSLPSPQSPQSPLSLQSPPSPPS